MKNRYKMNFVFLMMCAGLSLQASQENNVPSPTSSETFEQRMDRSFDPIENLKKQFDELLNNVEEQIAVLKTKGQWFDKDHKDGVMGNLNNEPAMKLLALQQKMIFDTAQLLQQEGVLVNNLKLMHGSDEQRMDRSFDPIDKAKKELREQSQLVEVYIDDLKTKGQWFDKDHKDGVMGNLNNEPAMKLLALQQELIFDKAQLLQQEGVLVNNLKLMHGSDRVQNYFKEREAK